MNTPFESDNAGYEGWLRKQCDVVEEDLQAKRQRMTENPFIFLRATFFRWSKTIEAAFPKLANAPAVLSVGDAHIENFGTWRDAAGRLVWGVNDFDDAAVIPYPFDLLRLSTSALLASPIDPDLVVEPILSGYVDGLKRPRATVVDDMDGDLQKLLLPKEKSAARFLEEMATWHIKDPPEPPKSILLKTLPWGATFAKFATRSKGGGGLGRPRYLVIGMQDGTAIVREAKAAVPSGWLWAHPQNPQQSYLLELARGPFRLPDPWLTIKDKFIIRCVAADSRKIDITKERGAASAPDLLKAMGVDLGSIHGSNPQQQQTILQHLPSLASDWLAKASMAQVDETKADYESWKSIYDEATVPDGR